MTLRNIGDLASALAGGRTVTGHARKAAGASFVQVASTWVDLSQCPGNPPANYYATTPLVAAKLDPFRGIFHGDDVSPQSKHLTEVCLATPTTGFVGSYVVADYLLYYPFLDGDETEEQTLDNTETLDRYTDGDGVQVMFVATSPTGGTGQFTFRYYNQAGVEKTSPVNFCSTASANIAAIMTSPAGGNGGPWLRLADGDTGVRSILGATFTVANGGLGALVLVKPLTDLTIREASIPVERRLVIDRAGAPQVYDGAYLNLLAFASTTMASGTLTARAQFAWSEE